MPCRDEGAYSEVRIRNPINTAMRKRLDNVTQNLCYLCGELTGADKLGCYASKRILAWWKDHQHKDAVRVIGKMVEAIEKNPTLSSQEVIDAFVKSALAVHPVSNWHRTKWFSHMEFVARQEYLRRLDVKNAVRARAMRDAEKRRRAISKLSAEERRLLNVKGV